jgi:uncharacterized membrane-anchored protein
MRTKKNKKAHRLVVFVALCLWLSFFSASSYGQEQKPSVLDNIKWLQGPALGDLGTIAEVKVPEGYVFAGAQDAKVLMEAMQNPLSGSEMGFLAPATMEWYLLFEFDDTGYVKDDEKDSLNADAMMKSIKTGNEEGNKERQKREWATMTITGWEQPPRYNPETHNLEWAIRAESQGAPVINYNTRLLGRSGVMKATLVADPAILADTLVKAKGVINDFSFKTGQKYAEFRKGDKLAKYGLSALVVGGATAVAVKSGLFKWLWKLIVLAALAVGAFFKRIFGKK